MKVKKMTETFKNYLADFDFDEYKEIKIKEEIRHIPANSCILPGHKIFDLLFKGSEFTHDFDKEGSDDEK